MLLPRVSWSLIQDAETDFLYKEIFGDHEAYSLGGIKFAPGQTIIDAGANIGMFALFAAQQCRGDARIFCFEPMPTTFGVLEQNALSASAGAYSAQYNPAPEATLSIRPFKLGLSDKGAFYRSSTIPSKTSLRPSLGTLPQLQTSCSSTTLISPSGPRRTSLLRKSGASASLRTCCACPSELCGRVDVSVCVR